MSPFEAVHRELQDAAALRRTRIVHIRVSTDAISGSVASIPVSPERARTLRRPPTAADIGILTDLDPPETLLEILIHPEDYFELLRDLDPDAPIQHERILRIMGVPVSR